MQQRQAQFHFQSLMLPGGWAKNVRLSCVDGVVAAIDTDTPKTEQDTLLGVGLPGMANLHSHAFQRGMAGLAERRGPTDDSFWTWRQIMYRFVERITPDQLRAIAAQAYIEMLESGFTRVGEFHYLHHDKDGQAYSNPAEMSGAIAAAAGDTGIALTHLPVFYAHAGFGGLAPAANQSRFIHDLDGFARLMEAAQAELRDLPDVVLGLAPHSLRAVTPEQLSDLTRIAGSAPIHIHIAEQVKEVEDCLAWCGARPVEWLLANANVDHRWCLVHATHLVPAEIKGIAASQAVVGLCPITEGNLGDGVFPARPFIDQEGRFGIGSDSNVLIDMTEELRLLEYSQRFVERSRNVFAAGAHRSTGQDLFEASLRGGHQALGSKPGLAIGQAADFVTLDEGHASLNGKTRESLLDGLIFAAGRCGIDGVWRRGVQFVAEGKHRNRERILQGYQQAIASLIN